MSVAAWSPLAGGILSGKYTRDRQPEAGNTRVDPATITEHQRRIATTLQSVADDIGATPAQVAIAWTRTRSPAIHPIVGARSVEQLLDNLASAELALPSEATAKLDSETQIDLGFPITFIDETRSWVFGAAALSTE